MPRYVILRHEMPADSPRPAHWDLMLETGTVLATWALDALPVVGNRRRGDTSGGSSPGLSRVRGSDFREPRQRVAVGRRRVLWSPQTAAQWRLDLCGNRLDGILVLQRVADELDRWTAGWKPADHLGGATIPAVGEGARRRRHAVRYGPPDKAPHRELRCVRALVAPSSSGLNSTRVIRATGSPSTCAQRKGRSTRWAAAVIWSRNCFRGRGTSPARAPRIRTASVLGSSASRTSNDTLTTDVSCRLEKRQANCIWLGQNATRGSWISGGNNWGNFSGRSAASQPLI